MVAERSAPFQLLVRIGFVARGVTYGVIGGIAMALAAGAGAAPAAPDQQGALSLIARAPAGAVALGVIAIGVLFYALWKLGEGVLGRGPEGAGSPAVKDRIANVAGGLAYLIFFAVAIAVLAGTSSGGSGGQQTAAAGVLGWPGGPAWVAGAGVALIAISAYQGNEAVRGGFARENKTQQMTESERRAFTAAGRAGLLARSAIFVIVGYFLIRTAVTFDPRKAVGVDGALAAVHAQPYGPALLGLVAAGLLAFMLFSFFEARFRRL
jgi:hypothetical protein